MIEKLRAFTRKNLAEKYTLIFIPDVAGQFRKISVPKRLVKGAGLLAGVLTILFIAFSIHMIQIRGEVAELDSIRSEAKEQKLQIQKFIQRVKDFEYQLARLDKFDKKLRVITALETSQPQDGQFGLGGPDGSNMENALSNTSQKYTETLLNKLSEDMDRLDGQVNHQELSFQELDEFFKSQKSLLTSTPSIWPARGWITSGFGMRKSPFTGRTEMHEGLDIASALGTPVYSPANGIVTRVTRDVGYGVLIEISHGYGVVTRYGHNSKSIVNVGDKLKRGDLVSRIGSTGQSTGPHLHYEVLVNGVPVNPYRYILED